MMRNMYEFHLPADKKLLGKQGLNFKAFKNFQTI
jgi:hypothetical protein